MNPHESVLNMIIIISLSLNTYMNVSVCMSLLMCPRGSKNIMYVSINVCHSV